MDNSRRRHLRTSLDFGTSNHVKPLSVFTVGFDVGQGSELGCDFCGR